MRNFLFAKNVPGENKFRYQDKNNVSVVKNSANKIDILLLPNEANVGIVIGESHYHYLYASNSSDNYSLLYSCGK